MTELQRAARLAFFYDAEVQNGGHVQFFMNQPRSAQDVIAALERLSLRAHAALLRQAHEGRAGDFTEIDSAYHELTPTISRALSLLLAEHQAQFVRVAP